MSNFLDSMSSLFSFFITQMGNIATFFTSNLLGQIILGCVLLALVVNLLIFIIGKVRGD